MLSRKQRAWEDCCWFIRNCVSCCHGGKGNHGRLIDPYHNIADGTIVPCYIAADSVQTPLEGMWIGETHPC